MSRKLIVMGETGTREIPKLIIRTLVLALTCISSLKLTPLSLADSYEPPASVRTLLKNVDFSKVTRIDEGYRAEFKNCDDHNQFRGHTMVGWRRCSGDRNNVHTLLKLDGSSVFRLEARP